jgi:hypothetical protein
MSRAGSGTGTRPGTSAGSRPRAASAPQPSAGTGSGSAGDARTERFAFAFSWRLAPAAAAFGVTPLTAHVEVDDAELHVRFGPWSLRTPLANVRSVERTGPYAWWKVAGPAHISVADRGVTFATSTGAGACIGFREPVPAALPVALLRHPAATVTVADPDALREAIAARTTLD